MGGNCVWLRCMLLLWHLRIYHNNYNSTGSLTLKVILRKSGGAARQGLISPRPPTRTCPAPTPDADPRSWEPLGTMEQGVGDPQGSPHTPTLTLTVPTGWDRKHRSKGRFQAASLGEGKEIENFLGLYLGQSLDIITLGDCSSSRPHCKFPIGNVARNYENV